MSIVGVEFECLNAIIWKWFFYIMQRSLFFSTPYNFFSKWLRNERVMDETPTIFFLGELGNKKKKKKVEKSNI